MRITNKAFAIFAIAGLASFDHQLPLQPDSRIWVSGGSTVRDWKCTAKTIDAVITAPTPETEKLPIDAFVNTAELAVPVAQLECGNGTMNEHMQKALKGKEFNKVAFALTGYTVAGEDVTVKGDMTIAGKTLPVAFPAKLTDVGGTVKVVGQQKVKMTAWGVKPPTLMLGTMKVKDDITIGFDVVLKR